MIPISGKTPVRVLDEKHSLFEEEKDEEYSVSQYKRPQ